MTRRYIKASVCYPPQPSIDNRTSTLINMGVMMNLIQKLLNVPASSVPARFNLLRQKTTHLIRQYHINALSGRISNPSMHVQELCNLVLI